MKIGPERTNTSKFQGFGFSARPAGPGAAAAPRKAAAGRGRPAAAVGGVAALFRATLEDDTASSAVPSLLPGSKPTHEALQAQRQADELLAQDPSIFQYDEVIDDIKQDLSVEAMPQAVRTEPMEQKKRVGLTVPRGATDVMTGSKRPAKYIEKVIVATDRRRVEQQIVEDRLLKKEKDQRKDCEVFVTEAFKEELKRRKKFEEELEAQEMQDDAKAVEKQENGTGFADMYRNLLNGGLATSRGGEKLIERAAPKVEVKEEEPGAKAEEVKAEEVKAEEVKAEEVKEEQHAEQQPQHGLQDVAAPADKKAEKAAEQERREQKASSARERYLARKQQTAAAPDA